jgi:uncharacterized membrane protein
MSRLQTVWLGIRDSLWFVPAVMTTAATLLALITVELDRRFIPFEYAEEYFFLFGAGAEGARGVLSALAQSIITVTGVVFSITIIALQLASTQYSPHILRRFMDDPPTQRTLGTFTATFAYALLCLRFVRSDEELVPSLSVTIAVVLGFVSLGALIYFINHIANSLKAESIALRIARETHEVIDRIFPEKEGEASEGWPFEAAEEFEPDGIPGILIASESGYLQAIDEEALKKAVDGSLTVRLDREVGDFVVDGEKLVALWPASAVRDERVVGKIREAFTIGIERTPHQDVERGFMELVDMAVKALSPSENDPGTVRICLDRLTELLVHLGQRAPPSRYHATDDGRLRFISRRTSFESALRLAVRPIRQYGEGHPAVMVWLVRQIGRVAALVPDCYRPALRLELEEVLARAEKAIPSHLDREEVRSEAEEAYEALR